MGTSATSAQLAAKLNRAANDLGQAQTRRRAVKAAADVAADIYNDQASKAGLSPGATLAGRTWGGYKVHQRDDDAAIIDPRGPVWLHNNPAKAYLILPRGERTNVAAAGPVLPGMARPMVAQAGRKRRRAGKDALKFKGRWSGSAFRKARSGERWASKAVAIIEKKAPEMYQREQSSVWRAVFK